MGEEPVRLYFNQKHDFFSFFSYIVNLRNVRVKRNFQEDLYYSLHLDSGLVAPLCVRPVVYKSSTTDTISLTEITRR